MASSEISPIINGYQAPTKTVLPGEVVDIGRNGKCIPINATVSCWPPSTRHHQLGCMALQFLSAHAAVSNLFNPSGHRVSVQLIVTSR